MIRQTQTLPCKAITKWDRSSEKVHKIRRMRVGNKQINLCTSCSLRTHRITLTFFKSFGFRLSRWLSIYIYIYNIMSTLLSRGSRNIRIFLELRFSKIAQSLVLPHWKRRAYTDRLPRELRSPITCELGRDMTPKPEWATSADAVAVWKTCKICPARLKRHTK